MKVFWITMIHFISLMAQTRGECLSVRNGGGLPALMDYGSGPHRITHHHQAIIPSYMFTCCGNITEWGADVQPGGRNDDIEYTIDFQLWRPSPTTPQDGSLGTGYYSLVGNNRFTSISLSSGVARGLSPSPQDYIQFRPGDILGFYVEAFMVEEARDDFRGPGVVVLTTDGYSSEVVWYASVGSQSVGSSVSVGISGDFTSMLSGAPVISISTISYSCPLSPMPPTMTAVIPHARTSKLSSPQPTSVPTLSPTESASTVTESPTNTEQSVSEPAPTITIPTDQSAVGAQIAAAVVPASTVIMLIIVSLLVGVGVYKRENKTFQDTHRQGNSTGVSDTINVEQSEAYGIFINDATTAVDEGDMYANLDPSNTIALKQNDAYTLEEPVTTTANESYNYPAKFDPSNTIEAKANEAYAMNIVTEENKAYKPVVGASGTSQEYEYI